MDSTPTDLPKADPKLLADLCDNASDLIVIVGADSRLLYWNRAWSRTLGYSREELSGRSVFEFLATDCIPECEDRLGRAIRGEEMDLLETRFVTKQRGVITVEGKCSATFQQGTLKCVRAIFRDITERKRIETEREELLKREHEARVAAELAHEQLASIFDRVTDAFVALDSDWRYTYVNEKAGELLGRRPENLIGRHIWTEFPEGVGQPFYESYLRAIAEQRPVEMEDYYAPWDRWFENRIFPSSNGISIYFQEITARKRAEAALHKSEAQFRCLSESGMIGIVSARVTGEVVEANDAFLEMIGYTREELNAGKVRWRSMTPPEWDPVDERAIAELKERGVSSPFEKEFIRKDGVRIAVLVGVAVVDGGAPGECISFVLNITPRKRAAQQLAATAEELRALAAQLQSLREEERTRVARELHDEFGAALTALKMGVVTIDRRLSRLTSMAQIPELRGRVEEILCELDALVKNVRRICTELRPGVLDQLGITAAIEWQAAEFQTRSGIRCILERPESVQLDAQNAIALFRIFQEILTNIARHANASEVRVRLSDGDGYINLVVSDNGRGIDKATLTTGRGLGLLGMRERALAAGGTVRFSEPATGGTSVTVHLPIAPKPQAGLASAIG